MLLGAVGPVLGSLPVHVTDRWTGPGGLLIGDEAPGGPRLVLPATRPTLRLPLLEAACAYPLPGVPKIQPSWFDPSRWPEREPIPYEWL